KGKVRATIRRRLIDTFGGAVQQIIVGGAGLNKDVETFLRRIKFPVTVGYGMTECGPLIAYAPWDQRRPGSCGRLVDRMELKVESPDPATSPGRLKVRGANVMKGYFHNPEATKDAIDPDGWMNTGDIVTVDPDGFITIKGRDKSMILGPSGQNIYPEEIEHRLNNLPYVAESLVVDREGRLVALIHPDLDAAQAAGLDTDALQKLMNANLAKINDQLPSYSKLRSVELRDQEFEKTPKRSIKRFLYH
ncbi:MAG: AMP-binding protein, partial [Muribaculaceae bacterium]|nr:AMP-binding protein [Muribaculaceae bacterium]